LARQVVTQYCDSTSRSGGGHVIHSPFKGATADDHIRPLEIICIPQLIRIDPRSFWPRHCAW
jgi:hypothetical protein